MANQTSYPDETLRDYVKGRLSAAEAQAIETAAAADPGLAAEIALVRGVIRAGDADARRASSSAELGWARLSRAIDAESGRRSSIIPRQFSRWQAAAVAIGAIAIWSLVAGPLLPRAGAPGDRFEMASDRPAYAHSAQATFVPTAQERAIREALRAAGAEIVEGPSALGVYVLAFRNADELNSGVAALRDRTDVVELVQAN